MDFVLKIILFVDIINFISAHQCQTSEKVIFKSFGFFSESKNTNRVFFNFFECVCTLGKLLIKREMLKN
jgi:hypothetical protein